MAPNQRLALIIMGSVLLLGVGRVFLVTSLSTKNNTDLATNIQGDTIAQDLEQQNSDQNTDSDTEQPSPDSGQKTSPDTAQAEPLPQLTLLLPPWASRALIEDLFQRLKPSSDTRLLFIQPDTTANYYKAVHAMSRGNRQADIMLIPRQDLSSLEERAAKVDRSTTTPPSGQFHPQVAPLLTKQATLFLPHAIDPRITVTTTPWKSGSLGNFLQSYASPWGLSGTVSNDPLFIRGVALWLDQLYAAKNSKLLEKIFPVSHPRCHILSCLKPTTALRIPLSTLAEEERTKFFLAPLPTLDNTLPSTVWGRVVRGNDDNSSIQQRLQMMQTYLQLVSEDAIPYDTKLLSPLHSRLQRTLLQDEWGWIRGSIYSLSLTSQSSSSLETIFSSLPISGLIDGAYRPELYIEKRHTLSTAKE